MNLAGQTIEEVVAELVAAIPIERLPPEARVAEIAMEREREVSTDLGIGVAVPHARIANLAGPVVVIGRSYKGIPFSASSANLVRLVFLLVTPIERPDVGLSLLAEIARIAGDQARRDRMLDATSEYEVIELVSD